MKNLTKHIIKPTGNHYFSLKTIFVLLIAFGFASSVHAQNTFPSTGAAGIGTTSPNGSSLLEVKSTKKGVLLPRMTKNQRDFIGSPAQGLLIYQTDNTPGLYYYEGGWSAVTPKNANRNLSNLTSPTAVNVSLLAGNSNSDLGSAGSSWRDIYLNGSIYLSGTKFITGSTSSNNTQVGLFALNANTSGYSNTAFGNDCLYYNTTGSGNTGSGPFALYTNTSGFGNTASGFASLFYNSTGNYNTAIGEYSLYYNNDSYNAGVGSYALYATTLSEYNTAVGYNAGDSYDNGYNNVFVGAATDVNGNGYYNVVAIGHGTVCTGASQAAIGNSSTVSIGGYANWTNFSDVRYKKNIHGNVPGLAFINLLKPITYTLDVDGIEAKLHPAVEESRNGEKVPNPMDNPDMKKAMEEKSKIVYTGFGAQEVEKAAESIGYDFSGVDKPKDDQQSFYGLRYGDFVVPLVKAVQELSETNDQLKSENEELQKKNEEFEKRISALEQSVTGNSYEKTSLGANQTAASGSMLGQNVPNPFGNSTLIPFRIPADCQNALILITNISSGEVIKLIPVSCNQDHVSVDGDILISGAYSYSLYVNDKMVDTRQMVVAK